MVLSLLILNVLPYYCTVLDNRLLGTVFSLSVGPYRYRIGVAPDLMIGKRDANFGLPSSTAALS